MKQDNLSIQEFNALLESDQDASPLLTALAQLSSIQNPDEVVDAALGPQSFWYGWN